MSKSDASLEAIPPIFQEQVVPSCPKPRMWSSVEEITVDPIHHHHGNLEKITDDTHRHHGDLEKITEDPGCHRPWYIGGKVSR